MSGSRAGVEVLYGEVPQVSEFRDRPEAAELMRRAVNH